MAVRRSPLTHSRSTSPSLGRVSNGVDIGAPDGKLTRFHSSNPSANGPILNPFTAPTGFLATPALLAALTCAQAAGPWNPAAVHGNGRVWCLASALVPEQRPTLAEGKHLGFKGVFVGFPHAARFESDHLLRPESVPLPGSSAGVPIGFQTHETYSDGQDCYLHIYDQDVHTNLVSRCVHVWPGPFLVIGLYVAQPVAIQAV